MKMLKAVGKMGGQAMAMAAVASVLAGNAFAIIPVCTNPSDCPTFASDAAHTDCVDNLCVNNNPANAPEMSDYLAMALAASSLGAVFYIRRRAFARA